MKAILFTLFYLTVLSLCTLQANASLIAGEGAYALRFDGKTQIRLPVELSQRVGLEMTFECWFQVFLADTRNNPNPGDWGSPNNITALNRPLISRFNTSSAAPLNRMNDFNLQINPEGKVVFFVGGTSNFGLLITTVESLESFRWYHVAFTIQYQNGLPFAANVFLDSWDNAAGARFTFTIPQTNWITGRTRLDLTTEPMVIGRYQNNDRNWPAGQFFVGAMDEVRIWRGVRSRTDIFDSGLQNSNRTVRGGEDWTISSTNGGTSLRGELVASYNFNDGTGRRLTDQGPYRLHGSIIGPVSWVYSNIRLMSNEYTIQSTATLITLRGYDTTQTIKAASSYLNTFTIFYDAALNGQLFTYNGLGATQGGIQLPNPGTPIASGDIITGDKIVYVSNGNTVSFSARFFYTASQGETVAFAGQQVEVRIRVACCCEVGDTVDYCLVCNGRNTSIDACGVCSGGNASCAGCDGIPYSGILYDVCGVCGGDNSSCRIGCDGVEGSGLVYDICGICGGDDSQCPGCDGVEGSRAKYDSCGVCSGTNSSCAGCDGRPNSGKTYDACGVCDGNNSTCTGCDNVLFSGKTYDRCNVCGGNDACVGCDDVVNSTKVYDACGVCDGNSTSCVGCDGVPSSGLTFDRCNVCNGTDACVGCDDVPNSGRSYDGCGVCGGNNSTCSGCDLIAYSTTTYDACGVCGGNNSTCTGCDGVLFSGKTYDLCGVCDGNDACLGCDRVPYSEKKYDVCGVCDGNNSTCTGCDGVPNSGKQNDRCGVCVGNDSCVGCDNVPNSGKKYDACGVCGGNNATCIGCDYKPNSGKKYDFCGVCGGNNGTCIGCDGYGGGVYDICGKCGGDNSTCGGCDGEGGKYDACGICEGDNSTCLCTRYHGFQVEEMEYMLVQYNIDQTMWKIQHVMDTLILTLEVLEEYSGPADLGIMVKYFNDFCEKCLVNYNQYLDQFTFDLRQSVGLEFHDHVLTHEDPYNLNEFPIIPNPEDMRFRNPRPVQSS